MTDSDHVVAIETVSDEQIAHLIALKVATSPNTGRVHEIMYLPAKEAALAALASRLAKQASAWQDVIAERQRQVEAEGWTAEHDDQHPKGEMARAAACYALYGSGLPWQHSRHFWPWDAKWWKPSGSRRDLVKAGALILAEIERLDRIPSPVLGEPK